MYIYIIYVISSTLANVFVLSKSCSWVFLHPNEYVINNLNLYILLSESMCKYTKILYQKSSVFLSEFMYSVNARVIYYIPIFI